MITLLTKHFSFRTESPEEVNLGNIYLKKTKDSWLTKHITSFIIKVIIKLFRISDRDMRKLETVADYNIMEGNKNIGSLDLTKISKEELNVMWIEVNEKYRGHGYAQKILQWVIGFAKKQEYKILTLEVPGISPDAKHIYEKLGFRETGQITSPDEDVYWGGLVGMKLKL